MKTGAVGLITTAAQVEKIISEEQADLVLTAWEFLREPYWPLRVASESGIPMRWPIQYLRAVPPNSPANVPVDFETLECCFAEHHGIPETAQSK